MFEKIDKEFEILELCTSKNKNEIAKYEIFNI